MGGKRVWLSLILLQPIHITKHVILRESDFSARFYSDTLGLQLFASPIFQVMSSKDFSSITPFVIATLE